MTLSNCAGGRRDRSAGPRMVGPRSAGPRMAGPRMAGSRSTAFFLIISGFFIFTSCSDSRIFDNDFDLPEAAWHVDSVQTFTIDVKDTTLRYNLYHKIRNASDYEFYNLYIKYTIADSLHQKLDSELQEMILFDPKTGTPYGSGLGDIFSHEFPARQNYRFPSPGKYYFKVQQYMRQTSLNGIHSVGLRVDVASGEAEDAGN